MRLDDFDYELPPERIAQVPCAERDGARLLVVPDAGAAPVHARVRDLPEWLRSGDLVVLNDTRVLPARLYGRRASGGRVELLLVERRAGPTWSWNALVSPSRRLAEGERIQLEAAPYAVRLGQRPVRPDGTPAPGWPVWFEDPGGRAVTDSREGAELLAATGHMPLPPYVCRPDGGSEREDALDRERYQTVYARRPGAVAAPTAGLHLTHELLERVESVGASLATVTLHVGLGTFRPVQVEDVRRHSMHSERYELPAATANAVADCRARGGRVVAVGTTSARVLETCAAAGTLAAGSGETSLYILPGYRFRAVDALLTNFHLPRSTLLMLVSAFAGRERVLALYAEAIERGYRFYSYGDAMLLFGERVLN